jgi:hypothetical protein
MISNDGNRLRKLANIFSDRSLLEVLLVTPFLASDVRTDASGYCSVSLHPLTP